MASNDGNNAQLEFKELIYPVDSKKEKILGTGQYMLLNKPSVDKTDFYNMIGVSFRIVEK